MPTRNRWDGVCPYLPKQASKGSHKQAFPGRFFPKQNRGNKSTKSIRVALRKTDLTALDKTLKSLFASIPYDWYRSNTIANYESYYTSVVYSFLAGAGFNLIP